MNIIPVIDIKDGKVVLAKQGDRDNYQPLSTPLCSSSELNKVILTYLNLHPFSRFYIADLDAIMNTGNNQDLISSLVSLYPHLNFMIDSGAQLNYQNIKNVTAVIGTESMNNSLQIHLQQAENFILSLDFSAQDKLMGNAEVFNSPDLWPKEVIIMTLGLVGKNSGPDFTKLQHFINCYPEHEIIAAGGIRHIQDLLRLQKIGINQVLVASALHNKQLSNTNLQPLLN